MAIVVASLTARPSLAATNSLTVHFDQALATGGQTLVLSDGAKAGIFRQALLTEADVTWAIQADGLPALPSGYTLLGSVYRLTIAPAESLNRDHTRPLAVVLPAASSEWQRQLLVYNFSQSAWRSVPTRFNRAGTTVRGSAKLADALYAVVENRNQQSGLATWYCQRSCSSRYPTLHATSNDFPVGSKVTVRSAETGRAVAVTIVSRWGKPAGRVIDLSWPAYAALRASNRGVTAVTVSPVPTKPPPSTKLKSKVEVIPSLTVAQVDSAPPPAVSAKSYAVFDQTSNTFLNERDANQARSIASLTKLMTAAVYLDTKPDLRETVVTYQIADRTGYDYLRVRPGETMTARDLFYAMLVGSANNAATALVRSAGLSNEEFVARMNAKAKEWGMTNTIFVDVTGLGAGNVSTAHDVALMAAHAFHDYQPIRFVTAKTSYTFITLNTKRTHTIKTTDASLRRDDYWRQIDVTGSKTGYTDEAQYTYAVRTKNDRGVQVITVVLGAPSSTQRFRQAAQLVDWTFSHYQWS